MKKSIPIPLTLGKKPIPILLTLGKNRFYFLHSSPNSQGKKKFNPIIMKKNINLDEKTQKIIGFFRTIPRAPPSVLSKDVVLFPSFFVKIIIFHP